MRRMNAILLCALLILGTVLTVNITEIDAKAGDINTAVSLGIRKTPHSLGINRTGLVAEWLFDEGMGQFANDTSWNDHNGTLMPSYPANTPAWSTGISGNALDFDGSDDYVGVSDADNSLSGLAEITISAWIRSDIIAGNREIVSKWDGFTGTNWEWNLMTATDDLFWYVSTVGGGTGLSGIYVRDVITVGEWIHISATWNGTTMKFYKNGQELARDGTDGPAIPSGPLNSVPAPIKIGADYNSNYDGGLDIVRIWDRALPPVEIFDLFNEFNISRQPIRIDSNADFDAAHGVTGGSGTLTDPWIIENYDINGTGYRYCIYVGNTTEHYVIRNCYLHEASGGAIYPYYANSGIILFNSRNGSIENNNASLNNNYGLYLYGSSNIRISGNDATNNLHGIYLADAVINRTVDRNNTIENNKIHSNLQNGIYILSSGYNHIKDNILENPISSIYLDSSSNNTIVGNNISNSDKGIHVDDLSMLNNITGNNVTDNTNGIFVWDSYYNNITSNFIKSNVNGIYLGGSSEANNVIANNVTGNDNGIGSLASTNNNTIYHNIISFNAVVQAYDDSSNSWDNGYPSGGNYWSDYSGVDYNSTPTQNVPPSDGIGDTPYVLDADSQDNYPLMTPLGTADTAPPIISSVSVDVVTDASATISWLTNEVADSRLNYSVNPDLSSNTTRYIPTMVSNHQIVLSGLLPATTYYFEVGSTDDSGNTGGDNNDTNYYTFTTSSADTTPPVSSVDAIGQYWFNASPLTITATADDPGSATLANVTLWFRYSNDKSSWGIFEPFGLDVSSPWEWAFDFPRGEGYYELYTIANDTANNTESTPVNTDVSCGFDHTAPEISDRSLATANTGNVFTFNCSIIDNLGVSEVHVIYWFGTSSATNSSMVPISGSTYQFNITIPVNSLNLLHYRFSVVDFADNWNTTTINSVTVTDDDDPVANAGGDQTVYEQSVVQFDGSTSTDNIGLGNYTWSFTYNGSIVLLYGISPLFHFWTPGNYTVTLNVTDSSANWDVDNVMIRVNPLSLDTNPPIADAGPDQNVEEGTIVTFDGSGSTDESGITNYTWDFTYDESSKNLYGVSPQFTFDIAGNYTITLNITDAGGNWNTDVMVVQVSPPATPETPGFELLTMVVACVIAFAIISFSKRKD